MDHLQLGAEEGQGSSWLLGTFSKEVLTWLLHSATSLQTVETISTNMTNMDVTVP